MIQFECTCKHRFSVDDDQAGADLQCPQCGRLNSVPLPGEINLLDEAGMYKLDAPSVPLEENPQRVEELKRIYRNSRVDEHGNEIDLRSHTTPLDYQRVGIDPLDLAPEPTRPPAPKYDPETGELIRPMEVRRDPMSHVRAALPAPKRPTQRVAVEKLSRVDPIGIFVALFKPANLSVIAMVLIGHLAMNISTAVLLFGFIMVIIGPILLLLALVSHYGNVVDELGPSSHDELPRPLRNVSWHDDLWGPFWAICLAGIICYGPGVMLWNSSIPSLSIRLACLAIGTLIGTVFAPAVLLTTTTSGHWVNLRPDRIWGTMRTVGPIYVLLVFSFAVALPMYLAGSWLSFISTIYSLSGRPADSVWISAYVAWPMLLVGLLLMHHFAWMLGYVYRVYHKRLPWAYQGALRGDDGEARGFAVVPGKPTPTNAVPMAKEVEPLPVHNLPELRTREQRLSHVRQSDAQRKRDSEQMIKDLPGGSDIDTSL